MIRHLCIAAIFLFSGYSIAQSKTIALSDFQRGFMEVVQEYSLKYQKAENELQQSALVSERMKRFESLKGNPGKIRDWYGVLEGMGTNSDGKAYVAVRLMNGLTVSTWNNGFSDLKDKTLLPQSSSVYKSLSGMKVGNVVRFSGKLKRPKNVTEKGKMVEPDFLFQFTDIVKEGDSVTR